MNPLLAATTPSPSSRNILGPPISSKDRIRSGIFNRPAPGKRTGTRRPLQGLGSQQHDADRYPLSNSQNGTKPSYTCTIGKVSTIGDVAPAVQAAMRSVPQLSYASVVLVANAVQVTLTILCWRPPWSTTRARRPSVGPGMSTRRPNTLGGIAAGYQSNPIEGADGTAPTGQLI